VVKLHNLRIDHVTIWSELKNLIGAQVVSFPCRVVDLKTGPIAFVRVIVGEIPLPQSGSGLERDPELTREFGTVPSTGHS